MEAVASTIMNRVAARRWANDVVGVIRQPRQFSALNKNDPNLPRLLRVTERDEQFRQALRIAGKAMAGTLLDRTNGADHYHERSIRPRWADENRITARIGRHIFYRLT